VEVENEGMDTVSTRSREDMLEEARGIIDTAREEGVSLRLMGGLAVRSYCSVIEFCDRDYSDIDMVGLSREARGIGRVFERLGYQENVSFAVSTGARQMQFYRECRHLDADAHFFVHPEDHVDIFMNTFRMDHDIDLRGRLAIEEYTISVSDLLLSKLQIHRINEKDIRDILTVMKDLPAGRNDARGTINLAYIAGLCAGDWGLYQDVAANVGKCMDAVPRYPLDRGASDKITRDLSTLLEEIGGAKKSLAWKLRAKLGRKIPWYREIEGQQ
jgi:hypothetical protein